ncbi:MAG: hypothetical protein HQ515_07655 [Phycisphaeraceae bacterium]|nr:hypothetical protein [Phycisphaeraceae bacterium]
MNDDEIQAEIRKRAYEIDRLLQDGASVEFDRRAVQFSGWINDWEKKYERACQETKEAEERQRNDLQIEVRYKQREKLEKDQANTDHICKDVDDVNPWNLLRSVPASEDLESCYSMFDDIIPLCESNPADSLPSRLEGLETEKCMCLMFMRCAILHNGVLKGDPCIKRASLSALDSSEVDDTYGAMINNWPDWNAPINRAISSIEKHLKSVQPVGVEEAEAEISTSPQAETEAGGGGNPEGEQDLKDDDALSVSSWAKRYNVDQEQLRKRLERGRARDLGSYIETESTKPRDPKYLYRHYAVKRAVEDLSGERPAKN